MNEWMKDGGWRREVLFSEKASELGICSGGSGQSTPSAGGHQEGRLPEGQVTAIGPPGGYWATQGSLQACPFSPNASFFECERQCDADPCCVGFGFLNVSQLKGNSDSSPPTACAQDFASRKHGHIPSIFSWGVGSAGRSEPCFHVGSGGLEKGGG